MLTDDIHRKKDFDFKRGGKKTNFMAPFREQILFSAFMLGLQTHVSVSVVKSVYTSHLSVCVANKHTNTLTDPNELEHHVTY